MEVSGNFYGKTEKTVSAEGESKMKNQDTFWKTILSGLMTLVLIFGAYAAVFALGAQNTSFAIGLNTINNGTFSSLKIPVGEYAFMSVTSLRSDGSPNINTNVHGSLVLNTDGTYEHSIYIGNSPGGCGPGTYSFSGDVITLNPEASTGCNAKGWKYIYDAGMNRLSLRDENVTLLYCTAGGNDCFGND